jgi:hypothetical protein
MEDGADWPARLGTQDGEGIAVSLEDSVAPTPNLSTSIANALAVSFRVKIVSKTGAWLSNVSLILFKVVIAPFKDVIMPLKTFEVLAEFMITRLFWAELG